MKNKLIVFLLFSFFISCRKETDSDIKMLTKSSWTLERYISILYVNSIYESTDTLKPIGLCNFNGKIQLNNDLTGRFESDCTLSEKGTWSLEKKTLNLSFVNFTPFIDGIPGIGLKDAQIIHLNKTDLHLQVIFSRSGGINPNTGKEDILTFKRQIHLIR
jgi:hypothetical protein